MLLYWFGVSLTVHPYVHLLYLEISSYSLLQIKSPRRLLYLISVDINMYIMFYLIGTTMKYTMKLLINEFKFT